MGILSEGEDHGAFHGTSSVKGLARRIWSALGHALGRRLPEDSSDRVGRLVANQPPAGAHRRVGGCDPTQLIQGPARSHRSQRVGRPEAHLRRRVAQGRDQDTRRLTEDLSPAIRKHEDGSNRFGRNSSDTCVHDLTSAAWTAILTKEWVGVVGDEAEGMAREQVQIVPDPAASQPARRARLRAIAAGLVGIGVVLLLAALVSLGVIPTPLTAPSLTGAIIDPPVPAPNFTLEDQQGAKVALSDFRGKVVVLTFLYTNCPDTCPIITEKLHQARATLGSDANQVGILAVTVDPANDTLAQVRAYSAQKGMLDKWHFLIGPRPSLTPIWSAYGIEALQDTKTTTSGSQVVDHSAPIYVIDRQGRERALLDSDFSPSDLIQDVHALLR